MSKHSENQKLEVVDVGLAKTSFHVHGVNTDGRKMVGKKLSRRKLKERINLPPCIAAMVACGGAHHSARLFRSHGHEARRIAPQFVKPSVDPIVA